MDAQFDLDVRRADEDRWLASRFAPAPARARLVALYALNAELAALSRRVRQPGLGDIRLEWWRQAVLEALEGEGADRHPVLAALAAAAPLPRGPLIELIEARARDFDEAPFADWAALAEYVDATEGALMRAAMKICGGEDAQAAALARAGGRAWGYTARLARGTAGAAPPGGREALRRNAGAAYEEARALAPALAGALFPAFGHLALVPAYLRAGAPSLLGRQLRLLGAAASGRLGPAPSPAPD